MEARTSLLKEQKPDPVPVAIERMRRKAAERREAERRASVDPRQLEMQVELDRRKSSLND